jgi:acyl-CoA thioesterase FadM
MTDAVINYLSEGFYGHKLKIDIGVKDITPKIFDIYYEIENKTTNKKLAIAKTGILGYDYTTTKPQEFSSKFIEIIS